MKHRGWTAVIVALILFCLVCPTALALDARADIAVNLTPIQDEYGNLRLEINITLKNGSGDQYISDLAFHYNNQPVASADNMAGGTSLFLRSSSLGIPYQSFQSDLSLIFYYIDFNGEPQETTLWATPARISEPKLNFTREVSAAAVGENEKVRLTYTVQNEGDVPLTNMEITDDLEQIGHVASIGYLAPGEKLDYTVDIRIRGDSASLPRVSYSTQGGNKIYQLALEPKDLVIYNPKLTVTLKADLNAVQAGDKVSLNCNVVNEGNVSFTSATISDPTLGVIKENVAIEVGGGYAWTEFIKPTETKDYVFTVNAKDESGKEYTAASSKVRVEVTAPAEPAVSRLELTASTKVASLEQPGEISFDLLLRNSGETTIEQVTISDQDGNVLERMNSIVPGDKLFTIPVTATESKSYTFTAEGKAPTGESISVTAAPIAIHVGLLPTQSQNATSTPEPTPTLTPTPLTAVPAAGPSPWLLVLFIFVVLLVLACIAVLIGMGIRSRRQRQGEDDYYDAPTGEYEEDAYSQEHEEETGYPDDYREQISRYASQYSTPRPAPPPAPPRRTPPPRQERELDDEDIPTVYKRRPPQPVKEPQTRRDFPREDLTRRR